MKILDMNQLHSSLKQALNEKDALKLITGFLALISNECNRHMIWMIDRAGVKTFVRADNKAQEPQKNVAGNVVCTHHMWLLVEPPLTTPVVGEVSLQTRKIKDSPSTAVGSSIVYAHARIISLKQKERALKAGITPRERETLLLLARGLRSDKVAYRMGIKRVTVNLHIANARRKLSSTTREQAIARAVHLGIITP